MIFHPLVKAILTVLEAQILRPSISLAREGRHRGGLPLSSQDVPGFQGLEKVLLAQSRPGVFKRFWHIS